MQSIVIAARPQVPGVALARSVAHVAFGVYMLFPLILVYMPAVMLLAACNAVAMRWARPGESEALDMTAE